LDGGSEGRTAHVVREAISRGRGREWPRIADRDVLVGASWIVVLVSGLGVLVWWLPVMAAMGIAVPRLSNAMTRASDPSRS